MLIYKKGTCHGCGRDRLIVKKLRSGGLCSTCNRERLNYKHQDSPLERSVPQRHQSTGRDKTSIKGSYFKSKRKPTGELEFFKKLWNEREHKSFISNEYLGNRFNVNYMFHILPKGSYPKYRLNPENIIFSTTTEHVNWHICRDKLRGIKEWDKVFELYERLKGRYNA